MGEPFRGIGPAIADNNLLSNFVDADAARLLFRLLGEPVFISPSVIEPTEKPPYFSPPVSETHKFISDRLILLSRMEAEGFDDRDPNNEPLKRRYQITKARVGLRTAFLGEMGILWQPANLTERIAARSLAMRKEFKSLKNRIADAECLALAETNGWMLLTDDSALVDAASSVGVETSRTCGLLIKAVELEFTSCQDSAILFNEVIVDAHGFRAYRSMGSERLWLRCNPPRCRWEPITADN